ncbi:hypothetical protein DVH05_021500 [Phytophthora capsici]|nr:hypothetical protein DVH05_021500 [Phytophthora capsici]
MRQRLDVVHLRLGWPILDAIEYQHDIMESLMEEAERQIYTTAGVDGYATGIRHTDVAIPNSAPHRHPLLPRCRISAAAYQALLQDTKTTELTPTSARHLTMVTDLNNKALVTWYRAERVRFNIPSFSIPELTVDLILHATGTATEPIRQLFAFLPYPEVAAQQLSTTQLERWGQLEVGRVQLEAIQRLQNDSVTSSPAQQHCADWIRHLQGLNDADQLIRVAAKEQWATLNHWEDEAFLRLQPDHISDSEWAIFHVLPFVLRQ